MGGTSNMRISGGEFRGRLLRVPEGDAVRPTQDRVREALFSMLHGFVEGARFLDLFAGSGGVGLEALSRGAAEAVFVECNQRHVACIGRNISTLGVAERTRVITADVYAWLAAPSANGFDVVYADPPYELGAEKGYSGMLGALAAGNVVVDGGLFISEMKSRQEPESAEGWELLRDRTYGQSRIAVYRRIQNKRLQK